MTAVGDRPEMVDSPSGEGTTANKVGYGNPPTSSQFKPGTSGNPRGRPRKNKKKLASLDRVLAKQMKITGIEGKPEIVTVQEAFLERLGVDLVKGDRSARRDVLKLRPDLLTTDVRVALDKLDNRNVNFMKHVEAKMSLQGRIELREVFASMAEEEKQLRAERQQSGLAPANRTER